MKILAMTLVLMTSLVSANVTIRIINESGETVNDVQIHYAATGAYWKSFWFGQDLANKERVEFTSYSTLFHSQYGTYYLQNNENINVTDSCTITQGSEEAVQLTIAHILPVQEVNGRRFHTVLWDCPGLVERGQDLHVSDSRSNVPIGLPPLMS